MSKRSLCWVNPSPKSRSKSVAPKSKASSKLNRSVKSAFITFGVAWCFNYHKNRGYLAKWGGVYLSVIFATFVVQSKSHATDKALLSTVWRMKQDGGMRVVDQWLFSFFIHFTYIYK